MQNQKNTFIITGAGSGIGRSISQIISEKNPSVSLILTGRNRDKLQKTLESLANQNLHQIIPMDITDVDSIKSLRHQMEKDAVNLNGIILNAGIGGENKYGSHDRWNEIIATNLTGPYTLVQELLPLMKNYRQSYKNIVFISSVLARLGVPKYSAYCASKAGLLGLMRSLAAELARDKILVNAICPGWVDTDMSSEGIRDIALSSGKSMDEIKKEQLSMVPLRKMSTPHEIAELVHFLMCGSQNSITGQTLDINNGALMP